MPKPRPYIAARWVLAFFDMTDHHQVVVMNQLATKYLTEDNKLATFNTGDRAVLMPQLGESARTSSGLTSRQYLGVCKGDPVSPIQRGKGRR